MKTNFTRTWAIALVTLLAISMTGCTERIVGNAALRGFNTFLTGVVNDTFSAVIIN